MAGQGKKADALVKHSGLVILGIDDPGMKGDFLADGEGALDGIGQEHLADPLVLRVLGDRQATDERGRYRMFRKLARHIVGQAADLDRKGAQCVEPENADAVHLGA